MLPISKQKFQSIAATLSEVLLSSCWKASTPKCDSSGSCLDVHSAFITLDDRSQQIMERSPRIRPPQGRGTSFIFASLECERGGVFVAGLEEWRITRTLNLKVLIRRHVEMILMIITDFVCKSYFNPVGETHNSKRSVEFQTEISVNSSDLAELSLPRVAGKRRHPNQRRARMLWVMSGRAVSPVCVYYAR
ncbi:hypothetical protein CEXT_108131 [Caerostris extrusa]|uniref:Uncharacterized protein n=1 Tax=Caerostris extrusa TaxID=172846 RepID=A0AAV4XRD0_CAEEX|nr:hypothetical protein CEXT_108131 [Caerostris extrusa]